MGIRLTSNRITSNDNAALTGFHTCKLHVTKMKWHHAIRFTKQAIFQNGSTSLISRFDRKRRRIASRLKLGNQPAIVRSVSVLITVGPGEFVSSGNPVSVF